VQFITAAAHGRLRRKTAWLSAKRPAGTITIRTDDEAEQPLDVLSHDGSSRSAVIRPAVLDAARRRERGHRQVVRKFGVITKP
jgi:hypothetical protein